MKSSKNKLNYGNVDDEGPFFAPEHTKVRISTMIDVDVVFALRDRAKKEKTKYQTLINTILRQAVMGGDPLHIDAIEAALLKRGFVKKGRG